MAEQEKLNPRSFKSIRQAVRDGRYGGRGELMRAVVDAFRAPQIEAKERKKAPPKAPNRGQKVIK